MKVFLSLFFLLLVSALGAFSTVSVKSIIEEHLTEISSGHTHEIKAQTLEFVEGIIADWLTTAGRSLCTDVHVDWEAVIKQVEGRGREVDIEGETLCALITNHIENVFEPVTTTLDQCGQAEHSGPYGRSVIMAIKAVVKHVCSISGEQILEIVNMCAFAGKFTAPECKQFTDKIDALRPGNITTTLVEEICEALPLGKECLLDLVRNSCKLEFTQKAWEDLVNSIMSPCSLKKL